MLHCDHKIKACTVCLRCPKCDCNHDGLEIALKLDRPPGRPVKHKASPGSSDGERETENQLERANKRRRITRRIRTCVLRGNAASNPDVNQHTETDNLTTGGQNLGLGKCNSKWSVVIN